jgi:hypothetical protein
MEVVTATMRPATRTISMKLKTPTLATVRFAPQERAPS